MATATALSTLYRVGDVADPRTVEKMRHQVRSDGLALFDGAYGVEAMLAVAGRMMSITAHPDSDDRGVTTIVELGPAANLPNAGGFSRRELMAHTDRSGVPDPPGLMMLTCTVQARVGGASQLPMAFGRASVPAAMLAELTALRAALPGYDMNLTSHSPARRYEAIRRDPGPGTWCLISTDPTDLWRELAPRARPDRTCPRTSRRSPLPANWRPTGYPRPGSGSS